MIYGFEGLTPELKGGSIFIAPSADVIGHVILHEDSSIWFNVTLRGDIEPIIIGRGSNIQDGSTVHTDRGLATHIAGNVTIGHGCVIHGCIIGEGSLIGMGSTILSGARIGRNCLVGGGSLVTGDMNVPDGMLVLGSPAKVTRTLKESAITRILENAAHYVHIKNRYLAEGIGTPICDRSVPS